MLFPVQPVLNVPAFEYQQELLTLTDFSANWSEKYMILVLTVVLNYKGNGFDL